MNRRALDLLLSLCTLACVGNGLIAYTTLAEPTIGLPFALFLVLLATPILQSRLLGWLDDRRLKRTWQAYALIGLGIAMLASLPLHGIAEGLLVFTTWALVHLHQQRQHMAATSLLVALTPLQTLAAMGSAPGPLWLALSPVSLLLSSGALVLLSQRQHLDSIRHRGARAHVQAWVQLGKFQFGKREWLTRSLPALALSMGLFAGTLLVYPTLIAIPRPFFNPRSPQLASQSGADQRARDQQAQQDRSQAQAEQTFPGDIRPGGRLGDLNYETVMTVQAYRDQDPGQAVEVGPLYMRAICLDTFTETGLRSSPDSQLTRRFDSDDGLEDGWITFDEQGKDTGVLLHTVQNVLRVSGSDAAVLFAVRPIRAIQLDELRHEPGFMLALPTEVNLAQVGFRQRMNHQPLDGELDESLVARHDDPRYLQLPQRTADARWIEDLSRRWTASANSDIEKVQAIVDQLHFGFGYSTKTNDVPGTQGIAQFLRRGQGHCTSFSAAAVFLMRCQGIPSRVATGFLADEYDQDRQLYSLSRKNGHAWIEVHFEGLGWQAFDPTPAGQRQEALRTALAGEDDGLGTWAKDLVSDLSAWAHSGADEVYFSPVLETLMRAPQAALASSRRHPGALALLLVAALLFAIRCLRGGPRKAVRDRAQPVAPHQALYQRWLSSIESRGSPRGRSQTLREWTNTLNMKDTPRLAEQLNQIVGLFYRSRFGERELSQSELEFIEQWIVELRSAPTPE